ncbi:MAG: ATP-binding protein [Spirochaetales bacterium]|nr:ATP-binding protein [Spirochaetales bacterium]
MGQYYKSNREHIYEELLLVDLLIHAEVTKFRVKYKEEQQNMKGLYISDAEIDEILEDKHLGNDWISSNSELDSAGWLTFLSSEKALQIQGEFLIQKYVEIYLPIPSYDERKSLWEKNLSIIFDAAEQSNAILFFDEADTLFGKRTEVKDAHDRYANIEVSYLLQKIDEYTGLVIMATNFSKNIDDAFERRLHFAIQFPFPNEDSRLRIWKGIFPPETPLDDNIDFSFLAKKFNITGGNIKNVAFQTAFFAAESGSRLTMEHIMCAGKREFDKMGRLWDNTEFMNP